MSISVFKSSLMVPFVDSNRQFFLSCYSKHCKDVFDSQRLICCTKCRQCFHSTCINPALVYDIVIRYPWHCNKCKVCVNCLDTTNENTMIICDACDRGFHIECTNQLMNEIPSGNWYCNDCQFCKFCDKQLSDSEVTANLYSVEGNKLCRPCMDNMRLNEIRFKNELCCVCSKQLDFGKIPENERVICIKCTQVSHMKCSQAQKKKHSKHQQPVRICNVCQKIESSLINLE